MEHSHPDLEARVEELEKQINGLSQLVAQMHVDLYTALIEQADESEDSSEAGT